jgi:hypothetical protein
MNRWMFWLTCAFTGLLSGYAYADVTPQDCKTLAQYQMDVVTAVQSGQKLKSIAPSANPDMGVLADYIVQYTVIFAKAHPTAFMEVSAEDTAQGFYGMCHNNRGNMEAMSALFQELMHEVEA